VLFTEVYLDDQMKENEVGNIHGTRRQMRNTDMKRAGRTETPVAARNLWSIILNWIFKYRA